MNTNEFSAWERQRSADRIQASGVRICTVALVVCYLIALGEMTSVMFGVPTVLIPVVMLAWHLLGIWLLLLVWFLVVDIIPKCWDWIRGY